MARPKAAAAPAPAAVVSAPAPLPVSPPAVPMSASSSPKASKAKAQKEAATKAKEREAALEARLKEIRHAADLLKQVSDPTRLQVLMLLTKNELNVTEICEDLPAQSQPSVSHHLALLRHGRLIEPRRSGKHNFYHLTESGRQLATVLQNIVG